MTGNIFVKNLNTTTRSKDLHACFAEFGRIFSCRVKYAANNVCRGYGYVQFETKEAAEAAIAKANGRELQGRKIEVCPFKARMTRPSNPLTYTNLFVKWIPKSFTKEQLEALFAPYGKITSAVVIKENPDLPVNKGFGFVCFEKPQDAKTAEEALKNKEIDNQKLYVARALSKEEHKKQLRETRLTAFHDCNLYVKYLSDDTTDDKLKAGFEEFGRVMSARVMVDTRRDLTTGQVETRSRNYGFVCFSTKEEAKKALAEAGKREILGRRLYVAIAERKEDRMSRYSPMFAFPPFPGQPPMGYYGMPPPMYPGAYMRPHRARPVPLPPHPALGRSRSKRHAAPTSSQHVLRVGS
jgi:polyadenylate-binding protein